MDRALSAHAAHPAVAHYARLGPDTGALAAHGVVLADLTDPPSLKERIAIYHQAAPSFRGRGKLEAWLDLLRSFSAASDFPALFEKHGAPLQAQARRLERLLRERRLQEQVEGYAGAPFPGRFLVLLSASYPQEKFITHAEPDEDGRYEARVMTTYQPGDLDDAVDEFLFPAFLHEFVHGVVDPLHGGFGPAAAAVEARYDVDEYVTQAVTERILKIRDEPYPASDLSRAFLDRKIMARLDGLLSIYESSRAAHPTLAGYYAALLAAFPAAPTVAPEPAPARAAAAEPDPADSEAWRERAITRFQAGQLRRALADLDHALALDPGNIDILSDRGVILLQMRRRKDALRTYREIAAICRRRLDEPSFRAALEDALKAEAGVLAPSRR